MKQKLLILLLLFVFLLTACRGNDAQETEAAAEAEPAVEVVTPTKIVPTATAVELPSEPTSDEAGEEITLDENPSVSECTLVSALPEPPQDTIEIFTVNENDWVLGPEDAAVTLIEYGDFQ